MSCSKMFLNLELLCSISRQFKWFISIKAYEEHSPLLQLQNYWLTRGRVEGMQPPPRARSIITLQKNQECN